MGMVVAVVYPMWISHISMLQTGSTPYFPTWIIIITNSPFIVAIVFCVTVEYMHRKQGSHEEEVAFERA